MDVGDGEIIFESGPRSLRPAAPNGTLTLIMLQELGLVDDMLITAKTAPAAQNRFIYYPDHLVRMPGPGQSVWDILGTIWGEPVFKGIGRAVLKDMIESVREDDIEDESIGAFLARRTDETIANNLASALFHGIYAGDIWQLSAKSILGLPWRRELKHGSLIGSAMAGALEKRAWTFCDDLELQADLQITEWDPKLRGEIAHASVFTFRRGVGQLAEALEKRLGKSSNVKIMRGTYVTKMDKDDRGNLKVCYSAFVQQSGHLLKWYMRLTLLHRYHIKHRTTPPPRPPQPPPSPTSSPPSPPKPSSPPSHPPWPTHRLPPHRLPATSILSPPSPSAS